MLFEFFKNIDEYMFKHYFWRVQPTQRQKQWDKTHNFAQDKIEEGEKNQEQRIRNETEEH